MSFLGVKKRLSISQLLPAKKVFFADHLFCFMSAKEHESEKDFVVSVSLGPRVGENILCAGGTKSD